MLEVRAFKRADGSYDENRWFVCFLHPHGEHRYINDHIQAVRKAFYFVFREEAEKTMHDYYAVTGK